MRAKILTLRVLPTLGGIDDTPLADFMRDKEVLSFREHFFLVSDVPHLCCVIGYQESAIPTEVVAEARRATAPRKNGRPDPTAGLDDRQRALFATLREWRAVTAREDGVPPYVILTNKQLVAILQRNPDSLTSLGHVDGIGPATVKQHGRRILELLHGGAATARGAVPATPAVPPADDMQDATEAAPGSGADAAAAAATDARAVAAAAPAAEATA